MFVFFSLCIYSDFFSGIPFVVYKTSTRVIVDANLYFVDTCLFSGLNSINGGGLYCSIDASKLLIENSVFKFCTASNVGGAIYYSSSTGASILNRVCGYRCSDSSTDYHHAGQFYYILTSNTLNNTGQFLSVSKCHYQFGEKYAVFINKYGFQMHKHMNSSWNGLYYYSGMKLMSGNNAFISYSTIISTFARNSICIKCNLGSYMFKYINVINNTHPVINFGIFRSYGSSVITTHSVFRDNSPKYLFAVANGGSLILDYCWIQSDFLDNGNLATIRYSFTSMTETHQIENVFNEECETFVLMSHFYNHRKVIMTIGLIIMIF